MMPDVSVGFTRLAAEMQMIIEYEEQHRFSISQSRYGRPRGGESSRSQNREQVGCKRNKEELLEATHGMGAVDTSCQFRARIGEDGSYCR
jgi:hypothetical protein